ncbi:MAG: diguanylate cyclase [Ilumatobacter sp.]
MDKNRLRDTTAGMFCVLLAAALIATAAWLFAEAPAETSDLDRAEETIRLVEARRTLERASLDVVALRMLDAIDLEGDRTRRLDDAARDVNTAATEIEQLAELDTPVGAEADVLLEDLWEDPLEDPLTADLEELFYNGEYAARFAGSSETVTDRLSALHQLTFVGSLPVHILIEGIAADTDVADRSIDSGALDFFDFLIDVVRVDGGWLGVEPGAPFDDSPWIELEGARERLPAEVERAAEFMSDSPLVEHDAWMRELGESNELPSYSLAAVIDLTDDLESDLDVLVDEAIADATSDIDDERASIAATQTMRRALGVAALLLGLVILVVGARLIVRQSRAARALALQASRDALTGAGNRHDLDDRVHPALADRRMEHHAVTMIDLDRFKMVNDTFGHAAGDAVLIAIANGLADIGAAMTSCATGASSFVVRLGGDEFLLSLHSPSPIDADELRGRLDHLREGSIEHDGETLGLGFSVGVIEVSGRGNLDDVLQNADLAVYDDKAARRTAPRTPTLPPPRAAQPSSR